MNASSHSSASSSGLHTSHATGPCPRPLTPLYRRHHHHVPSRPLSLQCLASRTNVKDAAVEPLSTQRRNARTPEDLNDPAKIGAKSRASVQVPSHVGGVSLQSYMTLPVEQYFVLDPKQIRHLGGNRFLLIVPRVNILNVWLEPEVDIIVTTITASDGSQKVVLQAENCRIKGSELIENLRIDQRFCMQFTTELTWDAQGQPQSQQGRSTSGSPGPSAAAANGNGPPGSISGDAVLDVWCEVIPPFNLMPRAVLQSTCNAVMSGLVNTLLPMFLRDLGADWVKWAAQADYRAERATRSKPMA